MSETITETVPRVTRRSAERTWVELGARVRIIDAEKERLSKELLAAIREAIPIGSHVEIPRGNGFVRGTVTRHGGCWWSRQYDIYVRLDSTGKEFGCSAYALFDPREHGVVIPPPLTT